MSQRQLDDLYRKSSPGAIPTGVGSDNRPVSVQLVAKPGGEDTLLALAGQLEQYVAPPTA